MNLRNNFTPKTRELYRDCWVCWECGGNGQGRGGLQCHHITGRDSNSPLNSSLLCGYCHEHAKHADDEEKYYFAKTLYHLKLKEYKITRQDEEFLASHHYLIHNNQIFDNFLKE